MKLSNHFSLAEFDCHDGTPVPAELVPNAQRLVDLVLEPIRLRWGAPLLIVSGYRTPAWNTRVGGAAASTHVTMDGCDPKPVHLRDVPALHMLILKMQADGDLPGLGGLGEYPNWVHVDTQKLASGRLRRWRGKGVGSEPVA
jgi:uncharacterized protein YcbK (DUF882 family)